MGCDSVKENKKLESTEVRLKDSRRRANAKYQKKTYDTITFVSRREDLLREQIDIASARNKQSKTQYIIGAIRVQLDKDGITPDMVENKEQFIPKPESKQPKQYMIYLITSWIASPEEYKKIALGKLSIIEDYVTTMQTLANAKTYVLKKYKNKAHPEDWYFTIYGRYFEAYNKLEANEKHKQLIESAMIEQDNSMNSDSENSDDWGWLYWLNVLNEMHKPDYVEIVKYEDIVKESADAK